MKFGAFIIATLALFFSSVRGQNDSATDCAKLDFSSLPTDCCADPFGTVLDLEKFPTIKSDCGSSSKLLEWINSYQLNNLQEQDLKNFINTTSKNYLKTVCDAAKYANCVASKMNPTWLFENGSLILWRVHPFLQDTIAKTAIWKNVMYNTCHPMIEWFNGYSMTNIVEDRFEKVTCDEESVNTMPLMFFQMLQSEIIWMCPKQKVYTDANKCLEKMKNFQFCDGKIYNTQARGIFFFPNV